MKSNKEEIGGVAVEIEERKYELLIPGNNNNNNGGGSGGGGGGAGGQKSRKSLSADPLEANKDFLFHLFQSDRLAWYYHKGYKNWEIVYVVEKPEPSQSQSQTQENMYIILTPQNQYWAVQRNEIHHIPPIDMVTAQEGIQKLIRALLLKFQETALYKNKPVMCEYQSVSYFGYTTPYFQLSKIDDYHIQNNAIDGVWISPLGETANKTLPYKKFQNQKNAIGFMADNRISEEALEFPISRQNVEMQKRQWYRELNRLQWENRTLQEKLIIPEKMELEKLRANAAQKSKLEALVRQADARVLAQEVEIKKLSELNTHLLQQMESLRRETLELKTVNNQHVSTFTGLSPTSTIGGSAIGIASETPRDNDDSSPDSTNPKRLKPIRSNTSKMLRSKSERELEDSIGRYETDIGQMRLKILHQEEELEKYRKQVNEAHERVHKASMSIDDSQNAFTRSVVQTSRLKEELSELKKRNIFLEAKLAEYEETNNSPQQQQQQQQQQPDATPTETNDTTKNAKEHIRSMTRQQIEEEIERYMTDNQELNQNLNQYQEDVEWYRVQLAGHTQDLIATERSLNEKDQEVQRLRTMSMQLSENMSKALAVDIANVELEKKLKNNGVELDGVVAPQDSIPEDIEVENTITMGAEVKTGEVSEKMRKMDRKELEQHAVDLQQQVERYEGDLTELRKQLAENGQTLEEEVKERANESAKFRTLSLMADNTNEKYVTAQKDNEQLRQQVEILKKNQRPDTQRLSQLEIELAQANLNVQTITQERDDLKNRLDTLWYEFKTIQDLYCLDQLQNHRQLDGPTPPFPTQETIISMYQSLITTHHSALHQEFRGRLEEKYPNVNKDINHELFIDYIGYEFLYHVIMECYKKMVERKNLFICATAELLQMSPQAAGVMIAAALQRSWRGYIGHTYGRDGISGRGVPLDEEETHLIESYFSRTTIDDTIVHLARVIMSNYKEWTFLTNPEIRQKLESFIARCCEVYWVMTLLKPAPLILYPPTPDLNSLNGALVAKETLNKTLSFVDNSIDTCENVLYYAIPAVILEGSNEVLYPAAAFTHRDQSVIDAMALYMKNSHKTVISSNSEEKKEENESDLEREPEQPDAETMDDQYEIASP